MVPGVRRFPPLDGRVWPEGVPDDEGSLAEEQRLLDGRIDLYRHPL